MPTCLQNARSFKAHLRPSRVFAQRAGLIEKGRGGCSVGRLVPKGCSSPQVPLLTSHLEPEGVVRSHRGQSPHFVGQHSAHRPASSIGWGCRTEWGVRRHRTSDVQSQAPSSAPALHMGDLSYCSSLSRERGGMVLELSRGSSALEQKSRKEILECGQPTGQEIPAGSG